MKTTQCNSFAQWIQCVYRQWLCLLVRRKIIRTLSTLKSQLKLSAVCFYSGFAGQLLVFSMPPRRSKGTPTPSSAPVTVAAAPSHPALAKSVEQRTCQQPGFSSLSPGLMNQLMSRVAQKVTRRLSALDLNHSVSSLPPSVNDAAPTSSHGPSFASWGFSFDTPFILPQGFFCE